jgi:serine/threonine-protein kinase
MLEKRGLEIGDVIPGPDGDTVRILRLIAEGGFSLVYEGVREPSGIPCAVKVLRFKHVDNAKTVERQLREGKALYALRHPNVVPVLFIGMRRDDQLIYLVMKLLRGRNLRELQQDLTVSQRDAAGEARTDERARLPVAWVLEIMTKVCAGLDAIHNKALAIHRDLKPENIFVEDDGSVTLFDIGSAKFPKDARLTTTGVTLGTAQYMSPEQLGSPADVDHRSDLFGLGTITYELLSGVLPFTAAPGESNDTQSLGLRIIFKPHRPLPHVAKHVPDFIVEIVDRLLAKKAADRYASAARVRDLLAAAHDRYVHSLGDLAPMPLAQAIAAIPRTATQAERASLPALPTSTNPFVTVSLPPDLPQGPERAPEPTTAKLPATAPAMAPNVFDSKASDAASGGGAAEPNGGLSPAPPVQTTAKLSGYVFVPPPAGSDDAGAQEAAPVSETAPPSYSEEEIELLRRLIAELPDELRRPFVLSQIHGKSVDEIAVLTGIPASTVRERVLEARRTVGARMKAAKASAQSKGVDDVAVAPAQAESTENADAVQTLSAYHLSPMTVTRADGAAPPARVRIPARLVAGLVVAAVLALITYGGLRFRSSVAGTVEERARDAGVGALSDASSPSPEPTTSPPPEDAVPPVAGPSAASPSTAEPDVARPPASAVKVPALPGPSRNVPVPRRSSAQPATPPPTAQPAQQPPPPPPPAPTASNRLFGTEN